MFHLLPEPTGSTPGGALEAPSWLNMSSSQTIIHDIRSHGAAADINSTKLAEISSIFPSPPINIKNKFSRNNKQKSHLKHIKLPSRDQWKKHNQDSVEQKLELNVNLEQEGVGEDNEASSMMFQFRPRKLESKKYDPWRDIYQQGKYTTQTETVVHDVLEDKNPWKNKKENFSTDKVKLQEKPVAADKAKDIPSSERRNDDDDALKEVIYYDEYIEYYEEIQPDYVYNEDEDDHNTILLRRPYQELNHPHRRPSAGGRPPPPRRRVHHQHPHYDDYADSGLVDLNQAQSATPTITRRVANAMFSPIGVGLASVIGIPVALAAIYWLFVVNGPTPVVRARQSKDQLGRNNDQRKYNKQFLDLIAEGLLKAMLVYEAAQNTWME